ncbi:alpha/beta fold hydrolase [Microbacterium sp. SA39]|uniref:alpha/beta fold hydrolase n=1 Tax=Microbacterium sp. SA39 TaxID=1263625 RepID=UPI001364C7AC|nr:alpha/beta fold hydrolase [Microbacterium sp. SA39]
MIRAQDFDRLYIHSGGRRGTDAWPHATDSAAEFLSFPADTAVRDQVKALVDRDRDRSILIFAHSIGAVSAVLAADRLNIAGLVLVEPALYDLARGDAAIERHIAIVTEARDLASGGELRGFWAILRPLMFGGHFDPTHWDDERALAERWASTNVPWGHGVRERTLRGIPTLAVTGGWNAEYEAIAQVLVATGARHVVLPGAQHRPQDLESFPAVVERFERSLS